MLGMRQEDIGGQDKVKTSPIQVNIRALQAPQGVIAIIMGWTMEMYNTHSVSEHVVHQGSHRTMSELIYLSVHSFFRRKRWLQIAAFFPP
mmetsp:Transcript_77971/g.130946  ORF Transcript_77971/g.130946 Transcript_77971/m.130946 type:complete len:90 (+) Transcript_77971:38-307(+)